MVFIADEGSEFDAPLSRVWEYLRSPEHRHTELKLLNREMVGDNVVINTSEYPADNGVTIKSKVRNTVYPPLGVSMEFVEGPLAGSKAFLYYIPKGNKTGVNVVGEFVGAGMDDKATKSTVMRYLEIAYSEDSANLKKPK
jgi:hypothetical protein